MKLEKCTSWHYQLQGTVNPPETADLVVVDIDCDQDPKELAKRKSNIPRKVVAYLSIGEAEDYRAYWPQINERKDSNPIVIAENPEWKGNYAVKFWDDAWQLLIIKRALEAQARGFTGLYLDKADVYQDIAEKYPHEDAPERRQQMVTFIKNICTAVPDMDVILQNAPELLTSQEVYSLVAGCGVEDLAYGEEETGRRNSMHSTNWRSDAFKTTGLPVFVVEYLDKDDVDKQQVARRVSHHLGFVLTIEAQDRALDGHPVAYFTKP